MATDGNYVQGVGMGFRGAREGGDGMIIISKNEPCNTESFDFTGDVQTVAFPPEATEAIIRVWGAGGAGRDGHSYDNYNGGSGGYVEQRIPVTPGLQFTLVVGAGGKQGTDNGGDGGWPNGGYGTKGDASGPGGGGLTGVF